jgi:hypothetical protein
MGPIFCPKTPAADYQSTLRNIPEERKSHLKQAGRLKSGIRKLQFTEIRRGILYCNSSDALFQSTAVTYALSY